MIGGLTVGLAFACMWIMGAIQGWNRAMLAQESRVLPGSLPPVRPPVRVGDTLWWIHVVALCWMLAGAFCISFGKQEAAIISFMCSLLVSGPAILHTFGYINVSKE